jgi:hypothetical protein
MNTNQHYCFLATEDTEGIPKILRYFFTILVLLINQKDYEHFVNVRVFKRWDLRMKGFDNGGFCGAAEGPKCCCFRKPRGALVLRSP